MAIQSTGSIAMLGGLYTAYRRQFVPTIISAVVVIGCNAWFLDRIAGAYGVASDDKHAAV
jgi:hypothetical protein